MLLKIKGVVKIKTPLWMGGLSVSSVLGFKKNSVQSYFFYICNNVVDLFNLPHHYQQTLVFCSVTVTCYFSCLSYVHDRWNNVFRQNQ